MTVVTNVTCDHCGGSGKIPLTGVSAFTLDILRKICKRRQFVVAGRDIGEFGCNRTALNNRLARLEEMGLIKSEHYGRERRFVPV